MHTSRLSVKKILTMFAVCQLCLLALLPAYAGATDNEQEISWQPAQRIDASESGETPLAAIDKEGNGMALWVQFDGLPSRYGVWTNRLTEDQGWAGPSPLNDYAGQASQPVLAMNQNGTAMALWVQYSIFDMTNPQPIRTSLWSSRYTPHSGWSAPQQIQAESVDPIFPQIAIDRHGNALAVWQQSNTALDVGNVYAKYYAADSGWGEARLLQTDNTINAVDPQLAMNPAGRAVVAWTEFHPATGTSNVVAGAYTRRQGWQAPQNLPGSDGGAYPQVAIGGQEHAVLVWRKMDPQTFQYNIYASLAQGREGWGEATLLQADTGHNSDNMTVAMNRRGEAIAMWKENTGDIYFGDPSFEVHANHLQPGLGWGGAEKVGVTANTRVDQMHPRVALNDQGQAYAVWAVENLAARPNPYVDPPTTLSVYHYQQGLGWDSGTPLQTDSLSGAHAQVALNREGEAIVVWQEQDMQSGATSLWASNNHH